MRSRLLTALLSISIVALFSAEECAAQDPSTEQVLKDISEAATDSARQRAYNRAARHFLYKDIELALEQVSKGEALGGKGSMLFGSVELRNTRGMIMDLKGETQEALADMEQALKWSEQYEYDQIAGMAHNNLGLLHWKQGAYEKALLHFEAAMKLNENSLAPDLESKAIHLNNIGLIHQELKRYSKALDFHSEALAIRKELGLKGEEAISLANMGLCYRLSGKLEWAEKRLNEAINLVDSLGNRRLYLAFHSNLGNVYYEKGNYHEALEAYLLSLGNADEAAQNPKGSFHTYSNLAAVMNALNNPMQALEYGNEAMHILEQHAGLLAFATPVLRSMAQSHFMLGNIGEGNAFLDRYHNATDSIFTSRHASSLADMEVKYETAKKEQQLNLQAMQLAEQEAKMQRNLILTFALAAVTILTVLLFIAMINRNKRIAQLAEREKEMQLKEVEIQSGIRSQEEERKRFAQDLHDGMGQLISTLKLTVARLKAQHGDPFAEKVVKESDHLLDEMHTEIRNIAFNLMPSTLIEAGLGAGIGEFAERLNQTQGLQVDTDIHLDTRLDEKIEIAVYRIVQEWVNNVIKHAQASHILVQVVADGRELSLVVEDDGMGFDTGRLIEGEGNGWRNILLRCKGINARIDVDSMDGRPGTTLVVDLPLMTQSTANDMLVNRA